MPDTRSYIVIEDESVRQIRVSLTSLTQVNTALKMATYTATWSNSSYWDKCVALDGSFNTVNKTGPIWGRQMDIEV